MYMLNIQGLFRKGPATINIARTVCAIIQECQTHYHWGSHQPCGYLQRAECSFRTV